MNPESPSEIERLARAITETRRLLEQSERILQEASGAFVERAAALVSRAPQHKQMASNPGVGETGS
ncbi:hypothetical protein [Noviluteimonas gilva]|uniref:Uncharacterized protein n=1 Tax=Noviluteimonas gilva TaxID=2682097 RepID=A0A7C9HMM8_9GAMM|nr:hypothetical protein [Lysobacter gilvus]MUV14657.1 hypothetical protein [Lysobacter gilvus]